MSPDAMPPEQGRTLFNRQFDVSRETIDRLAIYERLLQETAPTLSLVGSATLDDVWQRHFADSAQLLKLLPQDVVLDMGTGAGFPGMVLAIMGHRGIHLSENNQQKIAFLRHVAAETATTLEIHNCKAEALPAFKVATVTARAVAPLDRLLRMGHGFFWHGAEGLFLKGRNHPEEIEQARKRWRFEVEHFSSLTSEESSILRLRGIRAKT